MAITIDERNPDADGRPITPSVAVLCVALPMYTLLSGGFDCSLSGITEQKANSQGSGRFIHAFVRRVSNEEVTRITRCLVTSAVSL